MHSLKRRPMATLLAGLVLGFIAGILLPDAPVHAVATDRYENFAICTIPLDSNLEAVCVLDSLTGDLKGYVISPQRAVFTVMYHRNIVGDFQDLVAAKNPRFLMVSGGARIVPRGGALQRGIQSALYIAELTTGEINAYGMVWDPRMGQAPPPVVSKFEPIDKVKFRQQVIRPKGAVGAPKRKR